MARTAVILSAAWEGLVDLTVELAVLLIKWGNEGQDPEAVVAVRHTQMLAIALLAAVVVALQPLAAWGEVNALAVVVVVAAAVIPMWLERGGVAAVQFSSPRPAQSPLTDRLPLMAAQVHWETTMATVAVVVVVAV